MNIQRAALLLSGMILCMDSCLSQEDCTGVDCPVLQGCIETVLEEGSCCPTCTQRGCTCEGYQYYDCVQGGFRKGKVPEGGAYFVDFGSTECVCPAGGGKISCNFIPCPEIPPNCVDVLQPADGCPQCGQVGCAHGDRKYDAGHSFQDGRCQVCHCPNEGGRLTCSPIPGCDLRASNKPAWATTTENSGSLRDIGGRHDGRQTGPAEPLSKLALQNALPLYKQDPPGVGTGDYDYSLEGPTSSTVQDLAQLLESTEVPPTRPKASSTSLSFLDDGRHELRETQRRPESETSSRAEVTRDTAPTTAGGRGEMATTLTTTTQRATTERQGPQRDLGGRTVGPHRGVDRASQDAARANKGSHHKHGRGGRTGSRGGPRRGSHDEEEKVKDGEEEEEEKEEQTSNPTVQFNPTSGAPVRMREDREQPQTLQNYRSQHAEGFAEVPAKELLKTCCETGEKWASANGHCSNMEPPTKDRHSICWTAQQQCCRGALSEGRCSAGVDAARAGDTCRGDAGDRCGIDSYKECCDCCSLGLLLPRELHRCEAPRHLGFRCRHIFLTCCEKEDSGWHSVRERPAVHATPQPKKISDSPYPKEAFSIGEERDGGENAAEGPPEVEDMDECLMYEGSLCHHRCVNTPGSYRCECLPGYALQEDAFTCAQETVDEENRLKEEDDDGAAVAKPPPTQPAVPPNPCEGNGPCEHYCTSVGGRPQCSCFPGFSLGTADGHSCQDVNECLLGNACRSGERCVNTAGSYVCQRPIACPPGFQINDHACEDIDECVQQSHNCGLAFECVNTEGSFRCSPKPRCAAGFNRDLRGNCIDIDECGASARPCSLGFDCINTVGSYVCQRKMICSRGYHAGPDGSRCVDVDECQSGLHQCGEGQLCHNQPGSYRCECQAGYQYDSFRRTCVDVNECWRYPGRLCAQTCENTPGSFRCSCTSGFRLSADGKNCEDVNECLAGPCGQECANMYGSFQCYCRQGYHLREDGHTCEDMDECSQGIGHLCTYKCVNVPGSYQCACPEYGYAMSPNGRSCKDVDECATGAHNCSLAETCYNIQGGFRCLSVVCPPNYRKASDTRCERISCPNYLDCQNSPLRITYYYISFQSNIVVPAQIFRIGPSPAYSGDNVIVGITRGNEGGHFGTRKLNAYTGAVYLNRQAEGPRDFAIDVEMKLWRQGAFTSFQAKIFVFVTANSL